MEVDPYLKVFPIWAVMETDPREEKAIMSIDMVPGASIRLATFIRNASRSTKVETATATER